MRERKKTIFYFYFFLLQILHKIKIAEEEENKYNEKMNAYLIK